MTRRRVFFILAIMVSAALAGISFAATSTTTSLGVGVAQDGITVSEISSNEGSVGSELGWDVVLNSARSIPEGDLFVVAVEDQADAMVTVYLENPGALNFNYTYLQMKIKAFECLGAWDGNTCDGDGWSATAEVISGDNDEVYLNLTKGFVSFLLDGSKAYSVGVSTGSYYALDADLVNGALAPEFLVEARLR